MHPRWSCHHSATAIWSSPGSRSRDRLTIQPVPLVAIQWAWRQAGVNLPRTAAAQYGAKAVTGPQGLGAEPAHGGLELACHERRIVRRRDEVAAMTGRDGDRLVDAITAIG